MTQTPEQQSERKRYSTYYEFITGCRKPVEPAKGLLNLQDLSGLVFHKLWVAGRVPGYATRIGILWRCRCSCGSKKTVEVWSRSLTLVHVTDCGCRKRMSKRRKRDRKRKERRVSQERIRLATVCHDRHETSN
jgi:hypothetical protein